MMDRELWKKINGLQQKIEMSSKDEPKKGHIRNWYGSYDNAKLTEELLQHYGQAINGKRVANMSHEEIDIYYRLAGSLWRANMIKEAIDAYSEMLSALSDENEAKRNAAIMLATIKLSDGQEDEASELLSKAEDLRKKLGLPDALRVEISQIARR